MSSARPDNAFDWGDALPRVSGPTLDLRWLDQQDAPALLEIFGDPAVTRYWSSPPLPDLSAARQLVDEIQQLFASRTLFQWGICPHGAEEVIGTCTLLGLDYTHGRAEIGFALARASWGRGLASRAVGLMIGFAFETLGLRRLEADVDPRNGPSLRLLERQGFVKEGLLRERWYQLGERQDSVFLGLLRREWLGGARDSSAC